MAMRTPTGCRRINDEVYYADSSPFALTPALLRELAGIAAANPSGKARICCHAAPGDTLHDMFIALTRSADIRPHSHRHKVEAFQVIEGALQVRFYAADGTPTDSVELRAPTAGSEAAFYCRLPAGAIHTVVPLTGHVLFREVTNGPFSPEDTVYPDWACAEAPR